MDWTPQHCSSAAGNAQALHPRRGIHDPTASTPARAPHSLRRTSSVDMLRPDGPGGELILHGRGRDLRTDAAGRPSTLGEAEFAAGVDYPGNREVVWIRTAPEEPAAAALVGVRASSGFRAALDLALPEQRDAGSLLYMMLDDVPVATLISGSAIQRHPAPRRRPALQHPDLCAGWRTGGTILSAIEQTGHAPAVTGPAAPSLERDDDPFAWHRLDALPPHGMRRHRRLDLVRDGKTIAIDALFRDSQMGGDGKETIVHEYTVAARVDADTLGILEIEARPQVLPWVECPQAAASARDLRGHSLRGLRPRVRAQLTGASTCTHLNDTLRSLEDVAGLVAKL